MGCVQSYFRKALMGGSATKQQPPQAAGADDVPDNSLITESPAHSSGLSPSSTLESEKESSKDSSQESSSLKDSDLKEQVIKEEKEEIEIEKDFATFDQNEINETKKIENEVPVTAAKEINEEAPAVVAAAVGTAVAATVAGAALSTVKNSSESQITEEPDVIDNEQQSLDEKVSTENENEAKTEQNDQVEAEKIEDSADNIETTDRSNDSRLSNIEISETTTRDSEEKTTNEDNVRTEVSEQSVADENSEDEKIEKPVQEEYVSSSVPSQEAASSSEIPLNDTENAVNEVGVVQESRPLSSSKSESDVVVPEIKTNDAEEDASTIKPVIENNMPKSSVDAAIQPAVVSSTTDDSSIETNKQVDEQQSESVNETTEEKSAAEIVGNAPESTVLSSDEQVTIEQSTEQSISEKSSLIDDIVECDFLNRPVDANDVTIDNIDNIVQDVENNVDIVISQAVSPPVESKNSQKTDYDIITVDSAAEKTPKKFVNEVMAPVLPEILSDNAENEVIVVKAIIENTSNVDENTDLISETNNSQNSDAENIRQDTSAINEVESVSKSAVPSTIVKDDDTLNVTDIQYDAVSKSAAESLSISSAAVPLQESSTNLEENAAEEVEVSGTKIFSASVINEEEKQEAPITEIIVKNTDEKANDALEPEMIPEEPLALSETALETDKEESTITVPDSLGDLELPSESTAEDVSEKLETFVLSSEKANESEENEVKFEASTILPSTTSEKVPAQIESHKQNEKELEKESITRDTDIHIGYIGGIPTINLIESEDITISSSDEEVKTSEGIQNIESEVSNISEDRITDGTDDDSQVVKNTSISSNSEAVQEIQNVSLNRNERPQREIQPEDINSEENESKKGVLEKAEEETVPFMKETNENISESALENIVHIKEEETVFATASETAAMGNITDNELEQLEGKSVITQINTDESKALENCREEEIEAAESESSSQVEKPNIAAEVLDTAASTIQAAFRGYQTRQLLQKTEDDRDSVDAEQSLQSEPIIDNTNLEDQEELNAAATKIQSTFKGYQIRKTLNKTEDPTEESKITNTDENTEETKQDIDLDSAATKIQATFKGYQARKTLNKTEDQAEVSEIHTQDNIFTTNNEDIADEELNTAATKIQATFKGYQTRKLLNKDEEGEEVEANQHDGTKNEEQTSNSETKQMIGQNDVTAVEDNVKHSIDDELNSAAIKIQATFRSFQTRQTLQSQSAENAAAPETEASTKDSEIEDIVASVTEKDSQSKDDETPHASDSQHHVPATSEETLLSENASVQLDDSKVVASLSKEAENMSSSSFDADSSVSSAATKIQAGVRGYLTRKHISNTTNDTVASSFATEPSISDSQLSVKETSVSIDEDGIRVSESPETEIQKQGLLDSELEEHINGVEEDKAKAVNNYLESLTNNKPSSEDSTVDYKLVNGNATENHEVVNNGVIESMNIEKSSSSQYTESEEDKEVWKTIESELEDAATRIQSNYRGYRERQKLVRKDAVQVPTISSSSNNSSTVDSEETKLSKTNDLRTAGEFHDMVVLPPPDISEVSNESAVNSK